MIKRKIWKINNTKQDLNELITQLNISPLVAKVLMERGYTNYEAAKYFLEADLNSLSSPFDMHGIKEAVDKIYEAILNKEKIMIYGDYDVDGITSTALLVEFLTDLDVEVDYYIPNRLEEGYGLNCAALNEIKDRDIDLIITVDCGITAVEEISQGMELGLKFVITDHHQRSEILPNCTIVNPVLDDEDSPWNSLAGVGVAFKLMQGLSSILFKKSEYDLTKYLDLVALGTIADIVPLKNENRILVKNGIRKIEEANRIGLKILCEVAKIECKSISAGQIAFGIAPRLNACGRLEDAKLGVKLLLTKDEKEALAIAESLNAINKARQDLEAKILKEALEMAESIDKEKKAVIVLVSEDWHPGVIGIVASRLVDKYYLPTILLNVTDGIAKGSGRSISNFHLHEALTECEDLFIQFGGHSQAAGLSLREENIPEFINRINEYALANLSAEDFKEKLKIISEVNLNEVDLQVYKQLEKLEPYGYGNSRPIFALKKIKPLYVSKLGKDKKHLKLSFNIKNQTWESLAFNMIEYENIINESPFLDLAFTLDKNEWRGKTTLQLILKDIKSFAEDDNPYAETQPVKESSSTYRSKPKLIDYRNCSDKISYVKELVLEQKKLIIKTNSQQNTYNLISTLQNELPQIKDEIVFCENEDDSNYSGQSRDMFKSNNSKVYITSDFLVNNACLPKKSNIIIYDLPLLKRDLQPLTTFIAKEEYSMQIHLIYTKKDCMLNELILKQKAPDRECLGKFYVLLKKIVKKQNSFNLVYQDIIKGIEKHNIEGLDSQSMLHWLSVLEEVELIKTKNKGKNKTIEIKKNPPKVKLENSGVFRKGIKDRLEYEEVLKIAFSKYDKINDYIGS